MFGLGMAQIKASDMKLYALYRHYETDVSLAQGVVAQDFRPGVAGSLPKACEDTVTLLN